MSRQAFRLHVLAGHLSAGGPALQAQTAPTAATASVLQYTLVDMIPSSVSTARKAFASGRTKSIEWREQQLQQILKLCDEQSAAMQEAVFADFNRSRFETEALEVSLIRNQAKYALNNVRTWVQPEKSSPPLAVFPASCEVVREPLGTVCIIGAWNVPFGLVFLPLIGAIAAGNAAVVKPSELASSSAKLIGDLIQRYLDKEAVVVVQGGANETSTLLEQTFDHIIYTGGGRVGRIVMEKATKALTPVTLELGGKSPCIIDKDAQLDVAARRVVWARFVNGGQICIAPDYVLVAKEVQERFLQEVKKAYTSMYGADPKSSEAVARIVTTGHAQRLKALLDEDPSVRGQAILGGQCDVASRYVAPTVLVGTSPQAKVMQDEIFGPILPVLAVADLDEAIKFINARPKPLSLYIYSSNKKAQQKVMQSTSSGSVGVNECIYQYMCPTLPFGGVGASGFGKYQGKHSFDLFSNPKAVLDKSDSSLLDLSARYPPYTSGKQWLLRKVL